MYTWVHYTGYNCGLTRDLGFDTPHIHRHTHTAAATVRLTHTEIRTSDKYAKKKNIT